MKSNLRRLSFVSALAFSIGLVAQFAGGFTLPHVSSAALMGGLAVSCLLALLMGDYGRKPAFRVRRTESSAADTFTVNRPAGPGPDWTYTTRAK